MIIQSVVYQYIFAMFLDFVVELTQEIKYVHNLFQVSVSFLVISWFYNQRKSKKKMYTQICLNLTDIVKISSLVIIKKERLLFKQVICLLYLLGLTQIRGIHNSTNMLFSSETQW